MNSLFEICPDLQSIWNTVCLYCIQKHLIDMGQVLEQNEISCIMTDKIMFILILIHEFFCDGATVHSKLWRSSESKMPCPGTQTEIAPAGYGLK